MSLEQAQSDPNFRLIDAKSNKIGNDVLTYENISTGDIKTFPNVHHDANILPSHRGESQPLEATENDPKYVLKSKHPNEKGGDTLTFENKISHETQTYANVHHAPGAHVVHHKLDDIKNNPDWQLLAKHPNNNGNYTCIYQSNTGETATFANMNLE
jgi:hypothetical protein